MCRWLQIFWLAQALCLGAWNTAAAAVKQFGPFSVDPADPGYIRLNGEIGTNSALDFRRALNAVPDAKLVVLDSPGGSVGMALLIADDIHQRKLATLIPEGAGCYSACAYLFLAGSEREVDGKLGVHQISADEPDLGSAQLAISDIIDVLNKFETPVGVLTVMFRTPANSMHLFTPEEIADYGLERHPAVVGSAQPAALSVPETPAPPPEAEPSPRGPVATNAPDSLSVIESYARRPNRIAVYGGLDFFGGDLVSERTGDLVACASICLQHGEACKVFTFNVDDAVRGPNCFLKSSSGVPDANAAAISGVLLRRSEPDPAPFALGAIDPRLGVVKDTDIPGWDLGVNALASATSTQACRLACVRRDSCRAFTFVKAKKQCWLKSGAYESRYAEGMVSGLKQVMTFAPLRIIPLDR